MSSNGSYRLTLKRQRQEQLRRQREERRKDKVCQEATKLIADSRRTGGQFLDHLTQNFGQDAQQESGTLAQQAEQLLQSDPDRALQLARRSQVIVEHGITKASRQATEWSREKAAAREAVAMFRLALETVVNSSDAGGNGDKELIIVGRQLEAANTALRQENFKVAKNLALTGQNQIRKIEQLRYRQQEQEETRREIVHGFRQVLTNMGFTIKPPYMGDNNEREKVILVGALPSGRTARFAISPDGQVDYDFDGYRRRDCGKDHDKIRSQLQEQYQAKTSDFQIHWKDEPIQIGKTVLDLPVNQRNSLS